MWIKLGTNWVSIQMDWSEWLYCWLLICICHCQRNLHTKKGIRLTIILRCLNSYNYKDYVVRSLNSTLLYHRECQKWFQLYTRNSDPLKACKRADVTQSFFSFTVVRDGSTIMANIRKDPYGSVSIWYYTIIVRVINSYPYTI